MFDHFELTTGDNGRSYKAMLLLIASPITRSVGKVEDWRSYLSEKIHSDTFSVIRFTITQLNYNSIKSKRICSKLSSLQAT